MVNKKLPLFFYRRQLLVSLTNELSVVYLLLGFRYLPVHLLLPYNVAADLVKLLCLILLLK